MKINHSQNTPFKARNIQLKDAQKIQNIINSEFPRISLSRLRYFDNFEKSNILNENSKIVENMKAIRYAIPNAYRAGERDYNYCTAFLNLIKKYPAANCGENASLSEIVQKMNYVPLVRRFSLHCYNPKNPSLIIDNSHVFTISGINLPDKKITLNAKNNKPCALIQPENNSKAILTDSWLGEVDYVGNIYIKFKTLYNKIFQMPENFKFCLAPKPELFLSSSEIEKLRKSYPNLIIK